jgi:serine/threonine protein kinase/tetratricopeptide (TPR) repeat protein
VDLLDRLRTALAHHYAVQREIGRGGMAIVFLAQDLRHNRDVAIKVLKPEFAMAVSAERFLREIKIEAQLKHPYILPLFDSGEADGILYYVTPYVAGGSLRARLNLETQLPLDEALRITGEVAEALSHAHAHDIVHRDVKPGNILLDQSHTLLADFGIARAVTELAGERLSESGIVVGTPEYMSPEQCTQHGQVDARSDVYALGCVLYEMLAGEPPFTGPTAQAIVARHLHESPRSLRVVRATVPEHVEEAIGVALAKVPADRFTTATQFAGALDPEGITAIAVRKARVARRRNMLRTAAMLGGLASVVGLGLWTLSVPASPSPGPARAASAPPLSSIAVMYFEDRSRSSNLDYLSAGLTEDLIDELAAVPSLRVISPDGVKPYRGRNLPIDSIASALHIGTLVTGTISRVHDRLRATVRLTDAANRTQLFSATFEKPLGNVLDLRDQMVEEVARHLRVRLGEAVQLQEQTAGTRNPIVWDLVWRAERFRVRASELPSSESEAARSILDEADSLLVVADKLDLGWAEPAVLRGWLAFDQADRAADVLDTAGTLASAAIERWIEKGIRHAEHALKRSPDNPEALELRGTLLYRDWAVTGLYGVRDTAQKLEGAERDLRRAAGVHYRHQARALSTLSAVLEFSGKVAEANLAAEHAYEVDAYLRDANAIMLRLFSTSLDMKRYPEAKGWCERGRRTFPKDWTFLMCQLALLGWSEEAAPNVDRAWAILRELGTVAPNDALVWIKPEMTMMVAVVLARAGLTDSAKRVIAHARMTAPPDPQLAYYEALAQVRLKEPRMAAGLLAGLLRRSPNFLRFLRSRAAFELLWGDPRLVNFR